MLKVDQCKYLSDTRSILQGAKRVDTILFSLTLNLIENAISGSKYILE